MVNQVDSRVGTHFNLVQCHIRYKAKCQNLKLDGLLFDKTIITLQSLFEHFKIYEDIFDFLFSVNKLKSLDNITLKEKCLNLEKSLKHGSLLNIDRLNLFSSLNILNEIIGLENDKSTDILN